MLKMLYGTMQSFIVIHTKPFRKNGPESVAFRTGKSVCCKLSVILEYRTQK